MNSIFYASVFMIFSAFLSSHPSQETVEVEVIIRNIKSPKGQFIISFYNNPSNFPKVGKDILTEKVEVNDTLPHHIKVRLPAEKWYAIAMYQDEDGKPRIKQDILGVPQEPYAFSNNMHPKVAAPTFEACRFYVDLGANKPIDISLIHPHLEIK